MAKRKTGLTLGAAAKVAKTSKTSLNRAIKGNRLKAAKLEDGSYQISWNDLARYVESRAVKVKANVTGAEKPYVAGYWYIPSMNGYYAAVRRPRWLTRAMARFFFELEWKDNQ